MCDNKNISFFFPTGVVEYFLILETLNYTWRHNLGRDLLKCRTKPLNVKNNLLKELDVKKLN